MQFYFVFQTKVIFKFWGSPIFIRFILYIYEFSIFCIDFLRFYNYIQLLNYITNYIRLIVDNIYITNKQRLIN